MSKLVTYNWQAEAIERMQSGDLQTAFRIVSQNGDYEAASSSDMIRMQLHYGDISIGEAERSLLALIEPGSEPVDTMFEFDLSPKIDTTGIKAISICAIVAASVIGAGYVIIQTAFAVAVAVHAFFATYGVALVAGSVCICLAWAGIQSIRISKPGRNEPVSANNITVINNTQIITK